MNQDNVFQVEFRLAKKKVNALVQASLQQLTGRSLQTEGMKMILDVSSFGNIEIHGSGRQLRYKLPVGFTFLKPAGLFTIEGDGVILLDITTEICISAEMELAPKSTLNGYSWAQPPKVQMGVLEFPVEALADCIVRHVSGSWLDTLDDAIIRQLPMKELCQSSIDQFAHNRLVYSEPDLYMNATLFEIQANAFRETEEELQLDLWLELGLKISDKMMPFKTKQEPRFYWVNEVCAMPSQQIEVEYSFEGLAEVVGNYLNGKEVGGKKIELAGVSLSYEKALIVKLEMVEPIRSMVTISLLPRLNTQNQKMYADEFNIDIAPTHFLYKLSAPLIENFIENQVQKLLPFDSTPYLSEILSSIPHFTFADNTISLLPEIKNVVLSKFKFDTDRVVCTVTLEDASVLVEM
jgi:hypothetical protein